jgi:hypothetical protein
MTPFYKKSYETFCENVQPEDLYDYMVDNDIEEEHTALQKMYDEYEISYYELRGDFND